jgi:hypothetical protein
MSSDDSHAWPQTVWNAATLIGYFRADSSAQTAQIKYLSWPTRSVATQTVIDYGASKYLTT